MATRLDSLRDHGVDAGLGRRPRLVDRAHLHPQLDSDSVRVGDEQRPPDPEEHEKGTRAAERRVELGADERPGLVVEARMLEGGDDQVQAERAVGEPRVRSIRSVIAGAGMLLPPSTPQPPAAETAATSSGAAGKRKPAEKIG